MNRHSSLRTLAVIVLLLAGMAAAETPSGLHQIQKLDPEVERIAAVLHDQYKLERVAPGHCTGEPEFAALKRAFGNHYVYAGVGSVVDLPGADGVHGREVLCCALVWDDKGRMGGSYPTGAEPPPNGSLERARIMSPIDWVVRGPLSSSVRVRHEVA